MLTMEPRITSPSRSRYAAVPGAVGWLTAPEALAIAAAQEDSAQRPARLTCHSLRPREHPGERHDRRAAEGAWDDGAWARRPGAASLGLRCTFIGDTLDVGQPSPATTAALRFPLPGSGDGDGR